MSRNPFAGERSPAGSSHSEAQLLAICDGKNRWAYRIGFRKWYYVQPSQNGLDAQIQAIDGIAAEEVWTILDGKPLDYAGWSRERLDAIERKARWYIKQGTAQN